MSSRGSRQRIGKQGEDLACVVLQRRGYQIMERNWRCRRGEVDIVARDGDCWVFVEVKTRRGHRAEPPEAGLTQAKAARLVELAQAYLAERGLSLVDWRIDLLAIELDREGAVRRVNLIPGVAVD